MKPKISLTVFIFLLISSFVSAQDLTFGIENGINFSNVRKSYDYNRLQAQPGPINGIFLKYFVGDWITFQSGASHSTFYFSERTSYYNYYDDYSLISPQSIPYYSSQKKFSFLRIPLLIKFKTPGRVNFEIGGGAYYAFLSNDEYRGKDRNLFTKEYRDENFPPMNDWGWIMASSINFNVNNKLSLFLNGQVTTGHKEYFENEEGKMGSTEITLGFGYKPFAKGNNFIRNDSLEQNIRIIPHSGINISRTHSSKNSNKYGNKVGFSSGVSLKFLLSQNFSFFTGAWYERKGYSLNYFGESNFIYNPPKDVGNQNIPSIDSDTHLDYITFPIGFEFSVGKRIISNFSIGSYYSLLQNVFTEGEKISTYYYSNEYSVNKDFFNESLEHWFKKTDIGFMLGYRAEFPVFEWGDFFIATYQSFGIKNLFENLYERLPGQSYYFKEKMHNNSTTISFGLTMPISKN